MTTPVEMMLNGSSIGVGTIAALSLVYLLILFSVGRLGKRINSKHPLAPWVFSFSLSIYCTSWAFYGVTAQAAVNGWWMPPTYIGSFLLFWFGFKLIARIAIACRRYRITSVADFIATRFGHSRSLAVITTLIMLMSVVPYIALQLHAVSTSIDTLVGGTIQQDWYRDTGLYVSLWMAVFALLFVSRSAKAHQPNPGLMTAIAFESLVKLLALLSIGIFVCFGIYDGISDIFSAAKYHPDVIALQKDALPTHSYWLHVLLGFAATLCLPRQFHVTFVENQHLGHLRSARWIFPLYLVLIGIFTLPLALAGVMLLGSDANIDLVLLQIPMAVQRTDMALLAYLGGFSAATSMVVVATVVLGIMITNELVAPILYRSPIQQTEQPDRLKVATLRRISMLSVMAMGFIYYRWIGTTTGLAQLGLMAFALVAQLAPALILGLFSRKINRQGAIAGLCGGSLLWAYTLLLPELSRAGLISPNWLHSEITNWLMLVPHPLQLDALTFSVLLSLTINCLLVILVSRFSVTRVGEWLESGRFLRLQINAPSRSAHNLSVQDCFLLVRRFAGEKEAKRLLQRNLKDQYELQQLAPTNLIQAAERSLAAVVGGASMRLIMDASSKHASLPIESVARFVDEASQVFQFNQALLRSTIDNISQGISVVDADLRLIAWNQRYIDMFNYPAGLVEVGKPVADVIRYNLERGLIDSDNIDEEIQKRLSYLKQGSAYRFQRRQQSGSVLEMQGNPLPGGGFVTTYSDVSSFIDTQQQLEQRVLARTQDLQQLNQQLQLAQEKIEANTLAKNRFFSAASHDLMQPFNASALFASLLRDKQTDPELKQLSQHLISSLNSAEELLGTILELTKLDSGVITANLQPVTINAILDDIAKDASVLAAEKGLTFRYQRSTLAVITDRKLLKRVIQNLLANAIRYTPEGKVLLGVKRRGKQVVICVIDTGVGIAEDEQHRIFDEFHQGHQPDQKGLGLGLAIAHRMTDILQHKLELHSVEQQGSCFSVSLAITSQATVAIPKPAIHTISASFSGKTVLVLDNEPQLRFAVAELLRSWQINVIALGQPEEVIQAFTDGLVPDLILFDYHLDNAVTGVDVAQQISEQFQISAPIIIHSADHSETIRERALSAGYYFLLKPLKPVSLKKLFQRLLR